MSAHLLLDEMFSASTTAQLRERGIDASAINERPGARAMSDAEVLATAGNEGRVLVTMNYLDFLELDRGAHVAGKRHNGIIIVRSKKFSNSKSGSAALVEALAIAATKDRSFAGFVSWLE